MQSFGMGQAINQALREEMQRDANVFIAGEGIGVGIHSSPMLPSHGLLKDFGAGAGQGYARFRGGYRRIGGRGGSGRA